MNETKSTPKGCRQNEIQDKEKYGRKQWKRISTIFKMLKQLGAYEKKDWKYSNTGKGYWRISNSPILGRSLDNNTIANLEFLSLFDY
jgi:RNA-directed DNA polymerase